MTVDSNLHTESQNVRMGALSFRLALPSAESSSILRQKLLTDKEERVSYVFTKRASLESMRVGYESQKEYRSDDVIKMKFVKLWDLLRYSERTTSKAPTRQKLAIRGKLSLRY